MTTTDPSTEGSRARLAELLRRRADQPQVELDASYGQQALWFLYRLAPGSCAYNVMQVVRVRGTLDLAALRRTLETVSARHAALRTRYATRDGRTIQIVDREQPVSLTVLDASRWTGERLAEEVRERAERPFSLEHGPVWRVEVFARGVDEHDILVCFHHIAVDIWSLSLLLDEIRTLYAVGGHPAEAALPPATPYSRYVRWERDLLAGERGEVLRRYWQERLADAPLQLELPTDRPRPARQTYRGDRCAVELSGDLTARLKALARAEGCTLYTLLLAAYFTLLHRYTGQSDLVVGSPMTVRPTTELERLVGYAVNPVVLRADLSGDPPFTELLATVRRVVLEAIEHQDYPFSLLVRRLQPDRELSRSPVYQAMFIWDRPRTENTRETPGWELIASEQCGAAVDLTLTVFELPDGLRATLQYNRDLFDEQTVSAMGENLGTLLEAIVAAPRQHLSGLDLLTPAQRRLIVEDWNATRREVPECGVHELVERQALRTPDKTAVLADDGMLTYAELDRRADRLAVRLRAMGVRAETPVGVFLSRGTGMIVAMLAVLKAGGAYVPLDPAYPSDRLAWMLTDSSPVLILTDSRVSAKVPPGPWPRLELDQEPDRDAGQEAVRPDGPVADRLAYVIYTSGSTGRPNGVEVTHRNLVNFLVAMRERPGLRDDDVLLAVTSLSFDIAALEVFLPLTVGATVAVAAEREAADGARLLARLRSSRATVMQATPITWRVLLDAGWRADPELTVLCGGEALPGELAGRLADRAKAVWNLYGPTETTIWSTAHRVDSSVFPVPIGRPIANTRTYVLDAALNPLPIGVVGELCIGGRGVARGYRHRGDLTAERFVPDPFDPEPGARLFRTRDLARLRSDGLLEFLGRTDHQVKVRGVRIEPEEVEVALRAHAAVDDAVVVLSAAGDSRDARLVAYLTPRPPRHGVDRTQVPEPTGTELRRFLARTLPQATVPSSFLFVDALPLTANGKIDRRALAARAPGPDDARPHGAEPDPPTYEGPRTPLEKQLADLCGQVLRRDGIGVHDNFFDLGGTSLHVVEIVTLAWTAGLAVTPEALFQYQTIAELAAALEPGAPAGRPAERGTR
ncbi:amino acid adenylation domain-containing protein [Nonomuraea sp. NPDC051191]|uniref:amino acid adenylation domain-containing protein n=1 Tax=Nonomuraea sp. NPDC051191 TaxID=3364372 RepID=UPI003793E483